MMSKIGPNLSSIHSKLDVKSKAAVDELLACEVRMYVILCIFNVFFAYSILFVIFDMFLHIIYFFGLGAKRSLT